MNRKSLVVFSGCLALSACQQPGPEQATASTDAPAAASPLAAGSRPNMLLIVADDMGYQDLSVFGDEIPTPRMDAPVNSGLMLKH